MFCTPEACGHAKIWRSRFTPWGSQCLGGALISAAGPKKGSLAKPLRLTPELVVLESLFVRSSLAECHKGRGAFSSHRPHPMLDQFPESSWSVLDDVDLRAGTGSRRCRVVHSTSEEGFDWHAARHWKQDAMRPILGTS